MDRQTMIALARVTVYVREHNVRYWDAVSAVAKIMNKQDDFRFWKEFHESVKVVTGAMGDWTNDLKTLPATMQGVIDFYKENDLFA